MTDGKFLYLESHCHSPYPCTRHPRLDQLKRSCGPMESKVFISHASKDKPIADANCEQLELEGIECWIAPRDLEAGSDWT